MRVETDSYPVKGGLEYGYQIVGGRPAKRLVLSAAGGFASAGAALEAGEAMVAMLVMRAKAKREACHGGVSRQ